MSAAMAQNKEDKFLTVAPFECAWRSDLRFQEAGRGCVAFDAFAHNDVTVVFRENVGSQHYHYKKDNSPHYTVIIGSNRNRRLKIQVDGKAVVEEEGIGLCCSSAFQSYWISIYDGLISVGQGRYPFQNLVFQWLDSKPNCSVQYVGLSSWDKHVGYRNVSVFPLTKNHILLWKQVDCNDFNMAGEGATYLEEEQTGFYESRGLENFLESWDLSDIVFLVGKEEKPVPAHKVILQAAGNFLSNSSDEDVIQLQEVEYPVLDALLRYIYTGQAQVLESQITSLSALSSRFEVMPLLKQCGEVSELFKLNKKYPDSNKTVVLSFPVSWPHCGQVLPFAYPVSAEKLEQLRLRGQYSDVKIHIDGHGCVAQSHRVILSLWSLPFAKMFTNGMHESYSSHVCLREVSPEAFEAMLNFMYSGELRVKDATNFGAILLQLLLLADQYGVAPLHQECCKVLLECLSEDSVSSILCAVSSVPSCKLIEEMCKRNFSMHFDFCTTASLDFVLLDQTTFSGILQHPDLTVTSEEKILNAILIWGTEVKEWCGWEAIDGLIRNSDVKLLFKDKLGSLDYLLPYVRFPLLPYELLKKLQTSNLSRQIPVFNHLVTEAINYLELGSPMPENDQRYQHRRSSYKELRHICDGDSNGVLYFTGTSYGGHQWINPVLAKRITITASSPSSRHTDPKALASRSYVGTSFAGPRREDGLIRSWWMVDLGKDHQLMCNYYTLRQDGSTAYPRFWKFQGSMDGKSWTDLRVHEDDRTICKPGQFASWPIAGPYSLLPFRFFRVVLTGPSTDTPNSWNFCVCFLELYGYFR